MQIEVNQQIPNPFHATKELKLVCDLSLWDYGYVGNQKYEL